MRDEVRHVKVEAPACDRCGSDLTREPLLIFGPEAELLCSSCAEDVGEFSRAAALSTFGAYSWGDLVPRAGFVVERVLERCLSVLFAEEQVDRLRVSEFDEGVGAHESEPIAVRRAWLLSKTAVAPAASNTMTSQGTPRGRFQRAIHSRHVQNAEMAAREMGGLSLADALMLCELLARADPARYERAALRWLQRFIDERLPPLTEVALATSALAEVRHGKGNVGLEALKLLLRR